MTSVAEAPTQETVLDSPVQDGLDSLPSHLRFEGYKNRLLRAAILAGTVVTAAWLATGIGREEKAQASPYLAPNTPTNIGGALVVESSNTNVQLSPNANQIIPMGWLAVKMTSIPDKTPEAVPGTVTIAKNITKVNGKKFIRLAHQLPVNNQNNSYSLVMNGKQKELYPTGVKGARVKVCLDVSPEDWQDPTCRTVKIQKGANRVNFESLAKMSVIENGWDPANPNFDYNGPPPPAGFNLICANIQAFVNRYAVAPPPIAPRSTYPKTYFGVELDSKWRVWLPSNGLYQCFDRPFTVGSQHTLKEFESWGYRYSANQRADDGDNGISLANITLEPYNVFQRNVSYTDFINSFTCPRPIKGWPNTTNCPEAWPAAALINPPYTLNP